MRHDVTEAAELQMDALLGIRTCGRDESHATQDNNPYEPTPYAVLERLANSGLVGKRNLLVDYGCGKGRVGFYLGYQARCRSVGVELDAHLFACAQRNLASARSAGRVAFTQADAALYEPSDESDRFYFFNPFSAEVLARVLERIRASLDRASRETLLLAYYPDPTWRDLLNRTPWLERADADTVDCRDLFAREPSDAPASSPGPAAGAPAGIPRPTGAPASSPRPTVGALAGSPRTPSDAPGIPSGTNPAGAPACAFDPREVILVYRAS